MDKKQLAEQNRQYEQEKSGGQNEAGSNESPKQLATFAGGCFWCMVQPFDGLPGIYSVTTGYTGGHTDDPTYETVGTETTGHAEAVQIEYDPERFPYERLLELYWRLIDPTDAGGQFLDRGASYRTAIFYHNEEQRRAAEASRRALQASRRFKGKIVTEITPAGVFYPAEDVHQNYPVSHPYHYKQYVKHSGRPEFAEKHWDTPRDRKELKRHLTELQYAVTQEKAMEPAYRNAYWDNTREGVYVDVISGDPLFHSRDKFAAGTGWPGFTRPIEEGVVRREADYRDGRTLTAVRARLSGAFLGHLFHDGPGPDRLHYRINSAALHFIPDGGPEEAN